MNQAISIPRPRPNTRLGAMHQWISRTLCWSSIPAAPWRLLMSLIALILLTSCTNSKLVIGPLYNRLDDQIRGEFNKLGNFNDAQIDEFEATLGTFHVWHRQHEMPQYASLLHEIATSIARPGATTKEDVTRWAETIEAHSLAVRQCHPANFSFDLMQTLTDEQINFIERRFKRERKKNRDKYYSRTPEERIKRRQKNIEKWARRIGLEFTANQRAMLRTALHKQISLRRQYYRLSDQWNRQLFVLARDQDAADYHQRLSSHVTKLWSLLESAYPAEWQSNRELWRDFTFQLVSSMTDKQRKNTSRWLDGMGNTVHAIAEDEPSFTVTDDPSVGCRVGT